MTQPSVHPAERPDSRNLIRGRLTLGDFEVTILTDGFFLMDGGALYGVVPKSLWQRRTPADENNLLLLGTNTVVLRDGKQTIVVETGLGNKLAPKMKSIFAVQELLPASFAEAGIRPEEVDIVLSSHLHFDHCGWNTTRLDDGRIVPTFPNARYFAQRGEIAHARLQLERDAVSYLADNYEPLIASGQMTLLDGAATLAPGLSVEPGPGHTAHSMLVHFDSRGCHGCFTGDLVPTSAHLDPTWCTAFDLDPLTVIEQRKRLYARALAEDWTLFFPHDHHTPFCRIQHDEKGKIAIRP